MALDELPFYTKALAAWLASNCQDESYLLQGKALQDALACVGHQSLSEQDYQFLIASQELEKRELLKQLDTIRQETRPVIHSEFLRNISHELRTPINGIIGSLRLILEEDLHDPEEEREYLDLAHRTALHLLEQVNNWVDLGRLETGKFYLDLAPVNLSKLLEELETKMQPQVQEKQLSLQIIKPANQEQIILYGDYQRLLQVMSILVRNAIAYTDEGGITISGEVIKENVVVRNLKHPGVAKLYIADDRHEYGQDNLLRFLSWIDSSVSSLYSCPDTSLGISYKLVEVMGGELNFEIRKERLGSRAVIALPLCDRTLPLL